MYPRRDTTIAAAWSSYRAECIPAQASAVQVSETQAAFFAGAGWLLARVRLIPDEHPLDDDAGAAQLQALSDEFAAFALLRAGEFRHD